MSWRGLGQFYDLVIDGDNDRYDRCLHAIGKKRQLRYR